MEREMDSVGRARGCLLGGAIGDALGAPIEFMTLREIRSRFGPDGLTDYSEAYGRVGAITDDTQMTLWTAEGLVRGHARGLAHGTLHMPSAVYHAYLRWLKTQDMQSNDEAFDEATRDAGNGWLIGVEELHARRAPGSTCLSALMSPKMGTMQNPKNDSKGCGGVMRVAPVGLYEQDPQRAFELACEIAAITHGHPTGFLAAGCLAAIIAAIMQGRELREAVHEAMTILEAKPNQEETSTCLKKALALIDSTSAPTPETVEQLGEGWVAEEALAISVYCALTCPDDFGSPVLLAVNHSGDSDSTGAITGNILGALRGVEAIPEAWLTGLELGPEIRAIADELEGARRP